MRKALNEPRLTPSVFYRPRLKVMSQRKNSKHHPHWLEGKMYFEDAVDYTVAGRG
mgnify:FL=1